MKGKGSFGLLVSKFARIPKEYVGLEVELKCVILCGRYFFSLFGCRVGVGLNGGREGFNDWNSRI